MIREIQQLTNSDLRPVIQELPIPRWLVWSGPVEPKDVYGPALEICDVAEAEAYLIELVSWRARVELKRGALRTYRHLLKDEREAIAWYALNADVTLGLPRPISGTIPQHSSPNRIGEYPALDRVGWLYGAFLPEELGIRKRGLDVIAREAIDEGQVDDEQAARAEARRQRAAKAAGIVPPPKKTFLFEM